MKLNLQLFGGRGASSQGKRATDINKINKPKLGTINGEEIRSFSIVGEDTGDYRDNLMSLKEVYEAIQEMKELDRRTMGRADNYSVEIKTDTKIYSDYKLTRYKGKLKLK